MLGNSTLSNFVQEKELKDSLLVLDCACIKGVYYIPSSEILEFPRVINFDITSDDINFYFHFLP